MGAPTPLLLILEEYLLHIEGGAWGQNLVHIQKIGFLR